MSNALAIASVTATLQSILQSGVTTQSDLSDAQVTILPLDKARGSNTSNQLNLFLYMIARNAAWVSADMPRQVQPGEMAFPPLPLTLYYLITAFGRDDDVAQPFGHELLGKAMSVLHDHPVLSANDIHSAIQVLLPASDLDRQVERLRITLHPLSIDELSKLWTGFAMQYRLSAAYEVSVALIESTRSPNNALPVLARGKNDQGVSSQPNLTSPLPTLSGIVLPNSQPAARLTDVITLTGVNLDGTALGIKFNHPLWSAPLTQPPQTGATSTSVPVQIPNDPANWPPGFYTVSVLVTRPGESFQRETNQLSFALAPAISVAPASAPAGSVVYTVTVTPDVWPTQRASLIVGSSEFLADPITTASGTLNVSTSGLTAGSYWVRLRVDGVDSLLVDRSKTPPVFDPTQQITLT